MGVKIYRVKLHKVSELYNIKDYDTYYYRDGVNSDFEYVCDVLVIKDFNKICEVSTDYPLITMNQLYSRLKLNYRSNYKSNKPISKYVISDEDFVENNMVSIDEVIDYFSNIETKWLEIYNNELRKSLPSEQEYTLKFIKKMMGNLK